MFCSELRRSFAVLLCVAAALLAACTGDPPSVFQPDTPFTNPLLQPGLRGGIIVPPITGLPPRENAEDGPSAGQSIAETVSETLREAEIPASAAPAVNGRFALLGAVDPRLSAMSRIVIAWTLVDDHGEEVRHFATERTLDPAGLWVKSMAQDAAAALNRYVMEKEGLPPPAEEMPKLTIVAIDGAPGAGGRALVRSLEYHLQKAGLAVSDSAEDSGALIRGKLSLRPTRAPAGAAPRETLTVSWIVMRPTGGELGTIEQANDVLAGTLDRPWGDLAFIIAEGAAEGILDLLRRTAGQAPSKGEVNALASGGGPSSPRP